ATICVGMEPLHEFLIPRLDLDQGRGRLKIQRIERGELKPCQLALRPARRIGLFPLSRRPESVVEIEVVERIVHGRSAFSERPGWAMPRDRFVTEAFDFALTHALEIVPGLVVRAGMCKAQPDMPREFLAALGNAIRTLVFAARLRARANIHGGSSRNRIVPL